MASEKYLSLLKFVISLHQNDHISTYYQIYQYITFRYKEQKSNLTQLQEKTVHKSNKLTKLL